MRLPLPYRRQPLRRALQGSQQLRLHLLHLSNSCLLSLLQSLRSSLPLLKALLQLCQS